MTFFTIYSLIQKYLTVEMFLRFSYNLVDFYFDIFTNAFLIKKRVHKCSIKVHYSTIVILHQILLAGYTGILLQIVCVEILVQQDVLMNFNGRFITDN